jgi:hypothetical protein
MSTFMSLFAEYLTLRDEISRFMSTRFNSGAGASTESWTAQLGRGGPPLAALLHVLYWGEPSTAMARNFAYLSPISRAFL